MVREKLRITPMDPGDIPEIMDLEKNTLAAWSRKHLEDELQQPKGFQFVARNASSQKIQAVICGRAMADEAEILKLSVAENARQRGVGYHLLDFVVSYCNNKGVENCYLELRASNGAARKLYEKRGFIAVGTRKTYYEEPAEDAILMRLKL